MSREKILYSFENKNGLNYMTVRELKGILEEVEDETMVFVTDRKDFYTPGEIVIDEEKDLVIRGMDYL